MTVLLISTSPLSQRMAQFYTLLSRFATLKLLSPHTFVLPPSCHYGYFRNHTITQIIVHFACIQHILIPLVEAKRRQLASDLLDPAAPQLMNPLAQKFVADNAAIKAKVSTLRAVFSLDGAQDQTKAFMDYGLWLR